MPRKENLKMANQRRVINYEKCRLNYTDENDEYWKLQKTTYSIWISNRNIYQKILFIKYHYNINLLHYLFRDFNRQFNISRKSLNKRKFIKTIVFPVIAHILCSYHKYNDYNGNKFNYALYRRTMKEMYFTYKKHQQTIKHFAEDYAAEIKLRLHKKANASLVLLTQKFRLQNDLYNAICDYIA